MIVNKELLFNLVKKLEVGELIVETKNDEVYLKDELSGIKIVIGKVKTSSDKQEEPFKIEYIKEENDRFKEDFYKEKGLDKCWVKNCSNKIYQQENDYKKIKMQCQDKHTRMVCVACSLKL